VRQTILGTAKDLGAPGVDPVFGYGLLDVGRAVLGPAQLNWGDVSVSFSGSSTWGNIITGSGGIAKLGPGRLELTRLNSYSGVTRVLGGTLSSAFSVPGDAIVGSGGNLELLSGVLGDLDNQGTVTSLGTRLHSIAGNYQQGANARFAFQIGAPLQVTGHAQIDGDAQVLGIATGYTRTAKETVLSAALGLTGRFASLSQGPGVFLDASLGYDATSAWLDIRRLDITATAQMAGFSAMSVSSAQRIEQAFREIDAGIERGVEGSGAPLAFLDAAGAFQRTPTIAAAEQSLASLSGELHGADAAMALMQVEGNRHALESRLDALQVGFPDRTGGAWAAGLGGQRALARFSVDGTGWLLGQDRRFGDRWMLGAAFAQSQAFARHDLRGDREQNRQLEGQLYAQWQHGANYLLGRYALGRMQRSLQREVLLGAEGFAVESDYSSRYGSLGLQAGRRFDLNDATLTPYLGVQALRLDRGGFTEHGAAGFGLRTIDSTLATTQALLGARLGREWPLGGARMQLHARAEWQRTLSQAGTDIDARFTALDVWAPIRGHALDRDVGVFGIGLVSAWPRWGRLSVDLDGRIERGQTFGEASARWSLAF